MASAGAFFLEDSAAGRTSVADMARPRNENSGYPLVVGSERSGGAVALRGRRLFTLV